MTRRGKPVARLVPIEPAQAQAAAAVARRRELRHRIESRGATFTWEELKTYRDAGRR
ncbi:MAG: hypothetical protein JSS43_10330 [Proteobacteria bacterium]|nr:hypothetical protein [Pseudomonadota bacterium]